MGIQMKQLKLLGACLGAIGAMAVAGSASAATFTFSNPAPISIPGNSNATPFPSTINVSGITNVTDVNVVLNGLSHTYSDDIHMVLVGPGGQAVALMVDVGLTSDWTNNTVTFSDGAPVITFTDPGSDGTFGPSGPGSFCSLAQCVGAGALLSVFNGLDPNGVWGLYILDQITLDVGDIANGWDLVFEASEIPGPGALLLFATGLAGLGFKTRKRKRAA